MSVMTRSFASDNNAGVHPAIFAALQQANTGHVVAYGDDPYTETAIQKFKAHFGASIAVYFVWGGTGANVVGLSSVTAPYQAVICAESAHIYVDECGAPEHFFGGKLLPVPAPQGKLTPESIRPYLQNCHGVHHSQPHVISIAQASETGTVYTVAEIRAIADLAHEQGLLLHMDGARIANAAVYLNQDFRAFTVDAGVDVLSFGGTKNGLMYGEAVIFFDPTLAPHAAYVRKQSMQLASKMRFIAAQFDALLTGDLWRKNAEHANRMARLLVTELEHIPQIRITQAVQSNAVFAIVPPEMIAVLQADYFFYLWNENAPEVRWMTTFDTTEDDVHRFVAAIKHSLAISAR